MKFQGSLVPRSSTNHENLTTKFLSYKNLYILTALCLYLILLWCSILTLVRLDASNAMIKSIGNERRNQLLLREPKFISNTADEIKIWKQDDYQTSPIAANVDRQENIANGILHSDVQKNLFKSKNITKAGPFDGKLNNNTVRYFTDKIGKIINQTMKTAEAITLLSDSFYKNPLHSENNKQLNNTTLNNSAEMVSTNHFGDNSKHSPLLEVIELSKNELLEPVAESDQSHILSLIKTKKGNRVKPKSVVTTMGQSFPDKTNVVIKNDNSIVIQNVTPNATSSNFTSINFDSTTKNVNRKPIILMQSNLSDPVIKYINQSNKSEMVNEKKQNTTDNKSRNFNIDTVIEKSISSDDSKYTSAKPTTVTLNYRNFTTLENMQIENETKKIFLSFAGNAKIKNDSMYNSDTSRKPLTNNDMEIDKSVAGNTENVEMSSFEIRNYDSNITSTTPVPGATKMPVKAVISSKYDPAWRNKSLSAIGIKIGTKTGKETILYTKHAPTNLTVFTEKPKETDNAFKIPSLRQRLGQLSKQRYQLRKLDTNQNVTSTIQTTTLSPFMASRSTYTTSSAPWILYNGTHRPQDIQNYNTEPKMDSKAKVNANQKLLQGLSSSHIEFLYDFDHIPTPTPLLDTDQSFYSNNENVDSPEQHINGHQSNFAERMHFDLFHSVPKVGLNRPFKRPCEHKTIELFAEYDDNIGQYSSRNGEIRREKRDAQRVKSLTEFENLILNLTMHLSNGQNYTDTNEEESDDFWNYNSEILLPNFTRATETTTGKNVGPSTEVTSEVAELTFDDILNGKLSQNDTIGIVNVPTVPQANSSVEQKIKSKRKPDNSPRKLKPKHELKLTHKLNKTEVNNRTQSSILMRQGLTVKFTTIAPVKKKLVQQNSYKVQKPKLITPEAVEITVESKGHATQNTRTAQNITTDLAKLLMVLMSKTEDLD